MPSARARAPARSRRGRRESMHTKRAHRSRASPSPSRAHTARAHRATTRESIAAVFATARRPRIDIRAPVRALDALDARRSRDGRAREFAFGRSHLLLALLSEHVGVALASTAETTRLVGRRQGSSARIRGFVTRGLHM